LGSEVPAAVNSPRETPRSGRIGVLLGGGAKRHVHTGQMVYHLGVLDLDSEAKAATAIELGFLAHGVTQSPHDARRFVMFEKHGPGCCVVDVDLASGTGEVVRTIAAGKQRQFYGHGVFSADATLLYCTETDVADRSRGYIAVRDARDFGLLGEFPSYGLAPHDCMLADDGRTLVVSNGGSAVGQPEPPSVAWVDVADQSLRERVDVPDPAINAGHLAMTAAGDLALVSAPRDGLSPERHRGGVSLFPRGGALTTVHEPREITDALVGEVLSVAIHEPTRTVGATTPLGHIVTFWDLDSGALKHKLRVPNPRGIALSIAGDEFILNFGEQPHAARVDATTLQPVDAPGNRRGYASLVTGSHILVL
jgi:uncharacterized protein